MLKKDWCNYPVVYILQFHSKHSSEKTNWQNINERLIKKQQTKKKVKERKTKRKIDE